MRQFSAWLLHFAPTMLLMLMIVYALYGAKGRIVSGFMSILSTSNIMTGFFSHLNKPISFILGVVN